MHTHPASCVVVTSNSLWPPNQSLRHLRGVPLHHPPLPPGHPRPSPLPTAPVLCKPPMRPSPQLPPQFCAACWGGWWKSRGWSPRSHVREPSADIAQGRMHAGVCQPQLAPGSLPTRSVHATVATSDSVSVCDSGPRSQFHHIQLFAYAPKGHGGAASGCIRWD